MKRKFNIITVATLLFFITVTSNTSSVLAIPDNPSIEQAVQIVQECDNKIENNIYNLNKLQEQIIEKENEIQDNKKELIEAQDNVNKREDQLAERLNGIQLNGGFEVTSMQYIDALISSDNILDAVKKATFISQICTRDKNLVLEAKESKEKLLVIENNIDKEREELEKNKADVKNTINELEDQKDRLLKYIQSNGNMLFNYTDITVPVTLQCDMTETARSLIEEAEKYLKVPYMWGGETPKGFDCSGLMRYVFKSQGIELPRMSDEQQKIATSINIKEIKPGDLVFNKASSSTHVGLYIGNDMFIQAPRSGDVVKISKLSSSNMKYVGRILS